MAKQTATFAAGCFWQVEEVFVKTKGVISTRVGYSGGAIKNPTYEKVCTGTTGHAESIEIQFDSDKVSYEKLLDVFFENHDPTQLNRQGPDVGTQYRSAIFYNNEKQKKAASAAKKKWQSKFSKPIVTQIKKALPFYEAEKYHQKYLEKKKKKFFFF